MGKGNEVGNANREYLPIIKQLGLSTTDFPLARAGGSINTCTSWLGRRDSNPRVTGSEPVALPLGYSPMRTRIVLIAAITRHAILL